MREEIKKELETARAALKVATAARYVAETAWNSVFEATARNGVFEAKAAWDAAKAALLAAKRRVVELQSAWEQAGKEGKE